MTRRLRRLAAGAALVLPLATAGCGRKTEGTTAPAASKAEVARPVSVTVADLERRPVVRTIEVVGTLKGWEEVTIGAKRPGRVLKVFKDIGDTIAPGDPLVELETVDADLAVDQAEKRLLADLAKLGLKAMPKPEEFDPQTVPAVVQARVALERAERNFARERSLIARGAGTQMDLQNAQNDVDAGRATLDNAAITARATLASAQASKSALDQAIQARKDMTVLAPVPTNVPRDSEAAGPVTYAVTRRPVHEGQMVREGDPLLDLVIQRPLRLWVNVPERYTPDVRVGQEVQLSVASRSGENFQGTVARINPAVDPTSRTFQVEARVPNVEGRLHPGGFAKASIRTQQDAEAAVVPVESVVRFAGVTKIFVVEGHKARAIPVETGLEGKDWVEVTGKLPSRGQVVTSGQTMLANGTAVEVRGGVEKVAAKPAAGE